MVTPLYRCGKATTTLVDDATANGYLHLALEGRLWLGGMEHRSGARATRAQFASLRSGRRDRVRADRRKARAARL